MDPTLERALVRLGLELGATIVRDVVVPWLRSLLVAQVDPDDALAVARLITAGIARDYPDATGDEKAAMARGAIRQMLVNRGGQPTGRDVGLLLELSLVPDAYGAAGA